MAWENKLRPDENRIIIGFKHPMVYSNTIFTMLFKFGQCSVIIPKNRKKVINGTEKSTDDIFNTTSE